jgi:sigma-B regulation protein RsbU (phosphoserine phosphatase)
MVKRYQIAVNRLFFVICITSILLLSSMLFQFIQVNSSHLTQAGRISYFLLIIITVLLFHFVQIFPRWEKRTTTWLIVLPILAGAAISLLTLFSDLIIHKVTYAGSLNFTFGKLFILYVAIFGLINFASFIVLLFKTRTMENQSFKYQLFYLYQGINVSLMIILIVLFLLPLVFNIYEYRNIGLIISGMIIISGLHYAIIDERVVDLKQYYLKILYWITIVIFLIVPVYLIMHYKSIFAFSGQRIPTVIIALLIFTYLFLFFRTISPRIEKLFRKEYFDLERNVNEFFEELTQISDDEDDEQYWDKFFSNTIDKLETRFDISRASFYLYNSTRKEFLYSYSFGDKIKLTEINETHELILALKEHHGVLPKSLLFTEEMFSTHKDPLLKIFNEAGIQVILPFFNYEKEMVGLLFIGQLKNNKSYSHTLLSVLELYRIQFELTLANSILLEEVKATQIAKHDKIVVKSIKKKVKPKKLKQIDGIRLSSLYIDNSEYGGDFFGSVLISPQELCIFIANTLDLGVESSMLALELYTVLHMRPEKYHLPEQMLNTMNWVISTSRFSEKYVPAFSCIFSSSSQELLYSSAAFNPLIFFDYGSELFSELDTKGVPIGIDRNFSYESESIKVSSNSIGVLYSDGLNSAFNKDGDSYSLGRIKDIIRLNKDETPAVLARMVYTDFQNFVKDTKLINDVSLIIFKII